MPSAPVFLLVGLVVATALSLVAWARSRAGRSPAQSTDDFHAAMRALTPPPKRPD